MSTKTKGLVRLFSIFARSSKANKNSDSASLQVEKALELLKDTKFNFETITEDEKQTYVQNFTKILSTGLYKKDKTEKITHHFDQSLLGLNQILTKSTSSSCLDPISIKELVKKAQNESELLRIYDDLVHNGLLNLNNFKFIMLNKHSKDLTHIMTKLDFINNDGKFDPLKILVVTKAYILKDFNFAKKLYTRNINKWLYLRSKGQLPTILEKSLYQIIFKHDRSIDIFTKNMEWSVPSYILLIESVPKKILELKQIQIDSKLQLSRNQALLVNFLSFIISKQNPHIQLTINTLIRRLIKISMENHIHNEDALKDSELTIQKYRFINSITELSEDFVKEFGDDIKLSTLIKSLHETDDLLQNETVLKFI